MAFKFPSGIKSYINTNIKTNGLKAITGFIMNVFGIDVVDSFIPKYRYASLASFLSAVPDDDKIPGAIVYITDSGKYFKLNSDLSTFSPFDFDGDYDSLTNIPTKFSPEDHSHSWPEIIGKPSTFPPADHTHTLDDITDYSVTPNSWDDIIGKPSTFPPTAHTHPQSEITDLVTDLATKADKTNVLELDNEDSFTPSDDYHPATKEYVDSNDVYKHYFTQITSKTVSNTITETSLIETTDMSGGQGLVTSDFSQGSILHFNQKGKISLVTADTFRLRIFFLVQEMLSVSLLGPTDEEFTDVQYELFVDMYVTNISGSTVTFKTQGGIIFRKQDGGSENFALIDESGVSVDLDTNNLFDAMITFSAANASNSITSQLSTLILKK